MLLGRRTDHGRIRNITGLGDRPTVTVGDRDLVVAGAPARLAAEAAAAGLWRLQWVRLHLDGPTPHARLAGTTRHPHLRTISLDAALGLVARGVPAYVSGEGIER